MEYIISQTFVVLSYVLLGITYFLKNRKLILTLSLSAVLCNGVSYFLLKAWSGLAMTGVAILRSVIFLIQNRKNKSEKITWIDWIILAGLVSISAVCAVFTYQGFMSLLSVFATLTYTVSVWQKNVMAYKILGMLASILWIAYGIYIWSIFGVILECVMLVMEISGVIKEKLSKQKQTKLEIQVQE